MFYKAELENLTEIVKEDLIEFNSAIKNKQVNKITVDDSDNQVVIDLSNGKIFVQDSINNDFIDLQLSEQELIDLKQFGFKPILFRRVSLVRGMSEDTYTQNVKLFFGWSVNTNSDLIYRLVSLQDGVFVLHNKK